MKNEILKIIGNLEKSQVKKFRFKSGELQMESDLIKIYFDEKNSVDEVAERLVISLQKGTTTLDKIKKYVEQELAVLNRKLMKFNDRAELVKYCEDHKNVGVSFYDKKDKKWCMYQY